MSSACCSRPSGSRNRRILLCNLQYPVADGPGKSLCIRTVLVQRWAENVVWQYFSGQIYYEPKFPCDATQIGRFRTAIGEAGVEELLNGSLL